jgi:hypothetical protein
MNEVMVSRRTVQLKEMSPWELAQALTWASIGYLPLGTLEWHGKHSAGK